MQIEGRNPIKEALNQSECKLTKVLIAKGLHDLQPIIDLAYKKGIRVEFLDRKIMDKMSETGHYQGVIGIQENFKYFSLDEILASKGDKPLFLILLDNIEDPHNLGSIIRVGECLGVDGIVIPNKHAATVNSTVIKVSAGATSYVKIAKVSNINDLK